MENRRQILKVLGTGLLPASVALPSDRLGPVDLEEPVALLEAYMKLGGALDERLVIWWMEGIRYGMIAARSRPLYGMQVGMFQRFSRLPDGRFRVLMFELTYYTDVESQSLLRAWRNPYTDETNQVVHVRLGPALRYQTTAGQVVDPDPMLKEYVTRLGPAIVNGDHVWLPGEVTARIVLPAPNAPEIVFSHYPTVHGRLSELSEPGTLSAPAELSFQNVLRWEPWMRMGEHDGFMMSRASGRKLEAVGELPERYLACARELHPSFIADPGAVLDRFAARLDKSTILPQD